MVQKFLDMVHNDPKAKELAKSLPAPKSDAEAVEGYVRLAKDLGFDLTIDEIKAGLKAMENGRKAESDKVSLDDADLENVAGGANEGCEDTHSPGEWCWFTDSCSVLISFYGDEDTAKANQRIEKENAICQAMAHWYPENFEDSNEDDDEIFY